MPQDRASGTKGLNSNCIPSPAVADFISQPRQHSKKGNRVLTVSLTVQMHIGEVHADRLTTRDDKTLAPRTRNNNVSELRADIVDIYHWIGSIAFL